MTTAKGADKYTFHLAKCILHLRNASTYATVIANEKDVQFNSRATLRRVASKADSAVREFTTLLSPESMKVMREELLPDEICLQMEAITTMLLALPKGIRDEIETYTESRYNTYALNKD